MRKLSGREAVPLLILAVAGLSIIFPKALSLTTALQHSPLSVHMAAHILLMNAIAPLAALGWLRMWPTAPASDRLMATLASLQIALLYLAHSPGIYSFNHLTMPLLAVSAFLFWWAVFSKPSIDSWKSIIILALTGKLFCLLGTLIMLAPRVLPYGANAYSADVQVAILEDQQLAGLLMVVACPLTYVMAAIALSVRWVKALHDMDAFGTGFGNEALANETSTA